MVVVEEGVVVMVVEGVVVMVVEEGGGEGGRMSHKRRESSRIE